jgi:hypothetical protein
MQLSTQSTKNLILTKIKAKYDVVESYYMDDSTPDGPAVFSGSPSRDLN